MLIKLMPLPDLPPMNSEVPRRWRDGMFRADGEPGDKGGDVIPVSGSMAPEGLKEKVGRAAGIERLFSPSAILSSIPPVDDSAVENGRLPVALEYEDGAELDMASRAGKTKGGSGIEDWPSPGWDGAMVAIIQQPYGSHVAGNHRTVTERNESGSREVEIACVRLRGGSRNRW